MMAEFWDKHLQVQFHSSPGHLVIRHQLAPALEASDRTQTAGCIKNKALYKIQSAPRLCVKFARAERLLKSHLFLLCRWHWHAKVVRFVFALGGNIPWIYLRRADATRAWKNAQGTGAEITRRSAEARNTNKRRKRRLRFRDVSKSAGRCYPVVMPQG